jgi:hypothetical protein
VAPESVLSGGEGRRGLGPTVIHGTRHAGGLARSLATALAEEPRVIVCDLRTTTITTAEAVEVFTPVTDYAREWPGIGVVVVCPPDAEVRTGLQALSPGRALVVSESTEEGMRLLDGQLPELDRTDLHLTARLTAPRAARAFVVRALLDWRLMPLVSPATLVVSELVTNSVIHAASTVDLTLTRADGRMHLAVHDHGVGRPKVRGEVPTDYLNGRGLLLVREFTRGWGVFPAPEGKMVWAVLDTAS